MKFEQILKTMTHNADIFRSLTDGVSPEQARWKPNQKTWSVLEVINHMYDEEREDFRVRLDIILYKPDQPWPPINPEMWVTERGYNERDLAQSVEAFLSERRASLAWLENLGHPDWEAVYAAPFGSIRAGDMMTAWVIHDQLHMRQLVNLHKAFILTLADPYQGAYAGG